MSIQIKELNHFNIPEVRTLWNNFVRSQNPDEWLFYSYDWFKIWWQCFGHRAKPIILIAYQNEKIVGVATLHLKNVFYMGIYVKMLSFMANEHSPKSLIIVKNNSQDVVDALMQYILNNYKKTLIYLRDISKVEDVYEKIINYCIGNSLDFKERVARITTIANLSGTWERYLSMRSSNVRKKIKKTEKRIKTLNNLKITHYRTKDNLEECFNKLKKIAAHSWQGKKHTSFLVDRNLYKFYYQLAYYAAKGGFLDIKILETDKEPIAYLYDINIDKNIYSLKKEFNIKYKYYSPGVYLDVETLKEAYENGYVKMDMLGYYTDDKARWSTNYQEDGRIFIYNGILSKIIKFIDFNLRNLAKKIITRDRNYKYKLKEDN